MGGPSAGAVMAHATDAVLEASRSGTWKASRVSPLPSTATLTCRSSFPTEPRHSSRPRLNSELQEAIRTDQSWH